MQMKRQKSFAIKWLRNGIPQNWLLFLIGTIRSIKHCIGLSEVLLERNL